MRILFTFVGGRGHLEPLVPIARAAAAAGTGAEVMRTTIADRSAPFRRPDGSHRFENRFGIAAA